MYARVLSVRILCSSLTFTARGLERADAVSCACVSSAQSLSARE